MSGSGCGAKDGQATGRIASPVRRWGAIVGLLLAASVLTACSGGADTSYQVLTPAQLHDLKASNDIYLVNVHVPYEGEIPGTDAFIPYTEISGRLDELPFGEQTVVIYCRSGNMSTEAAKEMEEAGAPAFDELGGGFNAWQDAGYPLLTNNA